MRGKQFGQRGRKRASNPFSAPLVKVVTVKGSSGPVTVYRPQGPIVRGYKPYQGQPLPTPQRDKPLSRNDRRFYQWDAFKPR